MFCEKENIKCKNLIINPELEELRWLARHHEITTCFGSPCYVTGVRSRSANNTYVVEDGVELGVDQQSIPRSSALEIRNKVLEYLEGREVIRVDRKMGKGEHMSFNCRLYVTREYARIAYMWRSTLFEPEEPENPELVSVYVPEWPERKIMVFPEEGITYILGTDYFGEAKKSFLRMAMYAAKKKGGLGLHAGSKVIRIRKGAGQQEDVGFIMFGLSGTGKTTLTIHNHGLTVEERAIIRQDDVVFMDSDGYCHGTENGFYIKTEGLDSRQEALYEAATSPNSILENVMVREGGIVDFHDTTLTSNGRGVVQRGEIAGTDDSIDLCKAHKIIFITRRQDILPPVAKLNKEQAYLYFMLGESIETSAGDPSRAGQSKRCVGTNPFIIGPEAQEGRRLYEILSNNPDMECYLLNTGSVGAGSRHPGEKITIEVSSRIIEQIARDNIKWREDSTWGYMVPEEICGVDIEKYTPENYFSAEEYREKVAALREERKAWIRRFEGLEEELLQVLGG